MSSGGHPGLTSCVSLPDKVLYGSSDSNSIRLCGPSHGIFLVFVGLSAYVLSNISSPACRFRPPSIRASIRLYLYVCFHQDYCNNCPIGDACFRGCVRRSRQLYNMRHHDHLNMPLLCGPEVHNNINDKGIPRESPIPGNVTLAPVQQT